jgi:tyrosinase
LTEIQQELYKHIQTVAEQFPTSLVEQYTAAAQEFRAPYWDWALGPKGGDIPEFLLSPTIEVTDTDGITKMIPNPLEHYRFHPLIPEDFDEQVSPSKRNLLATLD